MVQDPSGSLKQKAEKWKPLIINHYQRFFFLSILQIEAEYDKQENTWEDASINHSGQES